MKTRESAFKPYQDTETIWLFDVTRNAFIEKRPDGTTTTHISPSGFKFTFPMMREFCRK